ncbi:MAG: DinB family protein [Gemmatimonadaceae bacterium]
MPSPSSARDTTRAEHASAVADFLDAARAIPDDVWERPLSSGKWSPAQVAEHVRLAYVIIQNELAGGTGLRVRTPWWLRMVLRWRLLPRILATGRLPAGAKASSEIRPGNGPFPRAPLLDALQVAANVAEESIVRRWDERGAGITHHVFGHVEIPRAMRFLTVHTTHHTRQLRDAHR